MRHFLKASAVGVHSLHWFRFHLIASCSLPLYIFAIAVASLLSLVDGVVFAGLIDVFSVPRFLVVFFFSLQRSLFGKSFEDLMQIVESSVVVGHSVTAKREAWKGPH